MFFSDYQIKILDYVYHHKYVRYLELSSVAYFYDRELLKETLIFLKNQNLLNFSLPSASSVTGYQIVSDDILVDSSRFSLTIDGYSFVEYRHREFWKFVVPYAITTFIALTNLVVSLVSLYCQFFR